MAALHSHKSSLSAQTPGEWLHVTCKMCAMTMLSKACCLLTAACIRVTASEQQHWA